MLLKIQALLEKKTWLIIGCGMFFADFAYAALPLPSFVEGFCKDYGIDICAGEAKEEEGQKKEKRTFTESEQEVLTRLFEKEKQLKAREIALNRRERRLKALEEDLQSQIAQLEKLQQEVEKDINRKKVQDREQLNKAVDFYAKMEPGKAAASIAQLNTKIAVQILLKIKGKQASAVLAQMEPEQSARLVEEIARKK
ncbi:MAG: hypothetical protein HQM14_15760 [SAR324 cluster bacterium]|nr:hypothetical protein [SAR324 cluster bacterium]